MRDKWGYSKKRENGHNCVIFLLDNKYIKEIDIDRKEVIVMMIIWFVGIGVLVYYLFFNQDKGKVILSGNKSPEEQLKERFVKGEIDEKTYLQMKETIK